MKSSDVNQRVRGGDTLSRLPFTCHRRTSPSPQQRRTTVVSHPCPPRRAPCHPGNWARVSPARWGAELSRAELKEVTGRSTPAPAPVPVPVPAALPSDSNTAPIPATGLLTIRVLEASGLSLPPGTQLPPSIKAALERGADPSAAKNRESLQRKQSWWLPCVISSEARALTDPAAQLRRPRV